MNRRALTTLAVVAVAAAAVAGGVPAGAATGTAADGGGAEAGSGTPTYVEENVTSDTTWTTEEGPYFVSDDVTVARGATLTIEPGTTVNVGEEVRVTVRGSLVANGTATDPVAVTTTQPSPTAGVWDTIEYDGGSDSLLRLRNTRVEYGQSAITATSSSGRIVLDGATVADHVRAGILVSNRGGAPTVTVRDSRFAALGKAGVEYVVDATNPYLEDAGRLTVTDTSFSQTGRHGVTVHARHVDDVTMRAVAASGVERAGVRFQTEATEAQPTTSNDNYVRDATLRGVSVSDAGGAGVRFVGGALDEVTVAGGAFRGLGGAAVDVHEATDADDVVVDGNTVTDAAAGVAVDLEQTAGGLQRVSLAVTGNDVERTDGVGVDLDLGYVVVEGVAVRNNTVTGNADGGVRVATQQLAATTVADNVVTANGGRGVEARALRLRGLDIERNRIADNEGAGVAVSARDELGGLSVTDNDVLNNDAFGVDVALDATDRSDVAASAIDGNTVVANGDGVRVAGPTTVHVTNNSVALNTASREDDGTRERASTGVHLVDATADTALARNDVYGHITGLRSAANGTVDAENNYWGAESGPYHATLNPDGAGDSVVTDRGKADPVPYASEPFWPRHERPTPVLVANETTVQPGDPVAFSARQSSDDGRVAAYYFTVDGTSLGDVGSATLVRSFDEPGTHEVSVVVEDDVGVKSLREAAVTVRVENATRTTTAAPTTTQAATTTESTTTTTAPSTTPGGGDGGDGDDRSLLDSLFTVWGGLGGALYGLAVALGGYGTYLSIRGRRPPFSGRVAHALAGAGVLTWAAAGVLVDGALLTFAGGGAVAWGGATGAVLALAS